MPKITAARIALTALIALTLTGCGGTTEPGADEPQEAVTETPAAPATVEPSEPASAGEEATEAEAWFLDYAGIKAIDLPDDDKIAAGYYACEQAAAGAFDAESLVGASEDENLMFMDYAVGALCPEHQDALVAYKATL